MVIIQVRLTTWSLTSAALKKTNPLPPPPSFSCCCCDVIGGCHPQKIGALQKRIPMMVERNHKKLYLQFCAPLICIYFGVFYDKDKSGFFFFCNCISLNFKNNLKNNDLWLYSAQIFLRYVCFCNRSIGTNTVSFSHTLHSLFTHTGLKVNAKLKLPHGHILTARSGWDLCWLTPSR